MVDCDANQKARKRNYAPKVKTGCVTCKIRRVKCDEAKPSCYRCVSTGRKCDGYEHPPGKIEAQALLLLPKPAVVSMFPEHSQDGHALELFNRRTGPRIAGFFDRPFWSRIIIQLGHNEPAIRSAMRAVSNVYEQAESNEGDIVPEMDNSTLQSYNKAIRYVVDGSLTAENRTYVPLIVCALFVCLEFLRGNETVAATHVRGGFSLLSSYHRRSSTSSESSSPSGSEASFSPTASEEELMEQLTALFSRLRVQSNILAKELSPLLLGEHPGGLSPTPRYKFRSLNEARDENFKILNESIELIMSSSHAKYTNTVSVDMILEQSRLEAQFLDARRAIEEFLRVEEMNLQPMDVKAINILVSHNISCYIWTATCLSPEETKYDKFKSEFETVVKLLATISDLPHEFLCTKVGHFQFDMGLIPSLHFIGSRCRWPSVRKECLNILSKYHWREGLFDSYVSYRYVKMIMDLEEASKTRLLGISEAEADDYLPPEGGRIHFVKTGPVDPATGKRVCTFYSKPEGVYGDWYSQKQVISGGVEDPRRGNWKDDVEDYPHLACNKDEIGPNETGMKAFASRSNEMFNYHLFRDGLG